MQLYVKQPFDAQSSHDQVVAFMQLRMAEKGVRADECTIACLGVGKFFPRDHAYLLSANDSLEALAVQHQNSEWDYLYPHTAEESFYNSIVAMRPYNGYRKELYRGVDPTSIHLLVYGHKQETAFARVQRRGLDLQLFVNARRSA